MRVPLSWLTDFVALDLPVEEVVATLDDLGLAVESVTSVGEGLNGVVVARVLEISPIAGADRIRAVTVDAGGPEPVPVVCGAWNFTVDDLVPLATVGTVLPGGLEIKARRMRGAASEGMLCAPDELGLPGDHDGILVLRDGPSPGTPVMTALGRSVDTVFELEVNANRPDAMSVAGVARDLAARLGLPFAIPEPKVSDGPLVKTVSIAIEDPVICGRFLAQVVTGIVVRPSPTWIVERLALAGMRPINNVVDASNYVMLELGQPTHPYDLGRLAGRGLRVRRARVGETVVTLDGVERALEPADPLICDVDDQPLGIAGIMGGASSEIDATTTEVVLEAAWFDPLTIARSSRRLKLRSEASARFEKGCDWQGIDRAAARFCELLHHAPGGNAVVAGAPVEATGHLPSRSPIRLRTERVNQLLGTDLSGNRIAGYLTPLGFTSTPDDDGVLSVELPSWRLDSATEIDVVEEVARLHGYRAIPSTLPRSPLTGGLSAHQRDRRLVRQILAGGGADEVWTTTFVSPADLERCHVDPHLAVAVTNPLVAEQSRLRTSLLPGLAGAVAANARRRQPGVCLFEIGQTFVRPPDGQSLPEETEMVACAAAGRDATESVTLWHLLVEGLNITHWRLAAAVIAGLHPTRSARVLVDDVPVGVVGELDRGVAAAYQLTERVAWMELDLGRLLAAPRGAGAYRPVSRFPSSDIDLAFEVEDSTAAADVERTLRQAGGDLVAGVTLFDAYRGDQMGPGRRSLAWTIRFQAPDRTLTDEEVAAARSRLVDAVEGAHPATLRT
ncbi:MAG TPA: phenylalanine--tRNA ligase subunit beta [Acidimicrobiales bacterium]|nr:phenylalanine--tRNA ligase subunit beta [Acidimicrobiales bacterium]